MNLTLLCSHASPNVLFSCSPPQSMYVMPLAWKRVPYLSFTVVQMSSHTILRSP